MLRNHRILLTQSTQVVESGAWGAASGALSPQLLQPSIAGAPQPQGASPQLEQDEQLLHSVLHEQVVQQPARRALRASRRVMHWQLHCCTSQPQGAAAEQPHAGAASHGQAGSQQTGSQQTGWQQAGGQQGLQHLFLRLNKPASASEAAKPDITTTKAVNTIITRFII